MDKKEGEQDRIFIKDNESERRCFQIFEKNPEDRDIDAAPYMVNEVDRFNRFYAKD